MGNANNGNFLNLVVLFLYNTEAKSITFSILGVDNLLNDRYHNTNINFVKEQKNTHYCSFLYMRRENDNLLLVETHHRKHQQSMCLPSNRINYLENQIASMFLIKNFITNHLI